MKLVSERQDVLAGLVEDKIRLQRKATEKYYEMIFEEMRELEEKKSKEASGVSLKHSFLVSVTVMFQNSADGSCADHAHGTIGAARRRRNRLLRAFLKHEHMTVAMNLATSAVVEVGVQVGSPLAPVTQYVTVFLLHAVVSSTLQEQTLVNLGWNSDHENVQVDAVERHLN